MIRQPQALRQAQPDLSEAAEQFKRPTQWFQGGNENAVSPE